MPLLLSQKNDVFTQVQGAGMDPREFKWDSTADSDRLEHMPSAYWFAFRQSGGEHFFYFMPASDAEEGTGRTYGWPAVLATVRNWLGYLERELEAPDLWAEIQREQDVLGQFAPAAVENTPFTPEEQEQIARVLTEVKLYVQQTQDLPEAQLREIEARLDYLVEAATRLPRLDWRNVLLGALLGPVVQASLPVGAVRDALAMIVRGVGQLFGTDLPGLPS